MKMLGEVRVSGKSLSLYFTKLLRLQEKGIKFENENHWEFV